MGAVAAKPDAAKLAGPEGFIDLVFIRHAECFHTAEEGVPSVILAQYTSKDEAVRDAVAPLVTRYDDPVRQAEGKWKSIARDAPFAVLTKADTPLLPSELVKGKHVMRLQNICKTLAGSGEPFIVAVPPLLRMKATAAIAASIMADICSGSEGNGGVLGSCRVSRCLLPRPSPLHTPEDVAAYSAAASDAAAAAHENSTSHCDLGASASGSTDKAKAVIGDIKDQKIAAQLLTAVVDYLAQYGQIQGAGGFVADDDADAAASEASAAAGAGPVDSFARWAFAEAQRSHCRNLVVIGGSAWWAGLVQQLGSGLAVADTDVLLPERLVDGPNGTKIRFPLMPVPAGARYCRLVQSGSDFSILLPTKVEAGEQGDAFATAAADLNPAPRRDALEREEWLCSLLEGSMLSPY